MIQGQSQRVKGCHRIKRIKEPSPKRQRTVGCSVKCKTLHLTNT